MPTKSNIIEHCVMQNLLTLTFKHRKDVTIIPCHIQFITKHLNLVKTQFCPLWITGQRNIYLPSLARRENFSSSPWKRRQKQYYFISWYARYCISVKDIAENSKSLPHKITDLHFGRHLCLVVRNYGLHRRGFWICEWRSKGDNFYCPASLKPDLPTLNIVHSLLILFY